MRGYRHFALWVTLLVALYFLPLAARTLVNLKTDVSEILPGVNGGTGVSSTATYPASGIVTVTVASGTIALATNPISPGPPCALVQTVSAPGVLSTDVLRAGFNGDPTGVTGYVPSSSGMLTIIPYVSAGAVNFKVCNNTGATITPGALTLPWQVTR